MRKFAEFGINTIDDKHIFPVPVVSIADVVNCEIEVLDFTPGIKTRHGDDRYIIKIRHEGKECKFLPVPYLLKRRWIRCQNMDSHSKLQ